MNKGKFIFPVPDEPPKKLNNWTLLLLQGDQSPLQPPELTTTIVVSEKNINEFIKQLYFIVICNIKGTSSRRRSFVTK